HLRYELVRYEGGAQRGIDGSAQCAVPMLVRRRYMQHGHVYREYSLTEQPRDLAQKYRDVIAGFRVHPAPDIGRNEQRIQVEALLYLRPVPIDVAQCADRGELYVAELAGPVQQRIHQAE